MLRKFEDPAVEKAYVTGEREARIPASRFLASIGMVTLLSYITFNPMHFPIEGVIAYNLTALPFVALLAALFGLTYTRFYVTQPWVDVVIFTVMAVIMVMLIEALGAQSEITDISRFGMAVINIGILLVFASVGFVGTSRWFFGWATVLLALYIGFLLQSDNTLVSKVYTFTNFTTYFTFACFVNWDIDRRARNTFMANRELEEERTKTEEMLHRVLPADVAKRLREGEVIADSYSDVSVIFMDIVGFSQLARKLSPGHLIKLLNSVFGLADACAAHHGIEKVKTVGDAYLAVAGGHSSRDKDAVSAIQFAQCLIREVEALSESTGIPVSVRVGIHTGNVVGGVVGAQRLAYDYWGSTMNVASRIESIAEPDTITVSESTYLEAFGKMAFSEPRAVELKGVGQRKVYKVESAQQLQTA